MFIIIYTKNILSKISDQQKSQKNTHHKIIKTLSKNGTHIECLCSLIDLNQITICRHSPRFTAGTQKTTSLIQHGRADWWRFSIWDDKTLWIRISSQLSKWLLISLLYNMLPFPKRQSGWYLAYLARILLLFCAATSGWTQKWNLKRCTLCASGKSCWLQHYLS